MQFIDIYDRLCTNDDTVYAEIVRRFYSEWIMLATAILWDQAEAEDVAQNVMLKFYRLVQQGKIRRDATSVQAFFRTMVRREAINRLRSLRRWSQKLYEYLTSRNSPATPHDRLIDKEHIQELMIQIGNLPARQRQCCYLFYVWNESSVVIADQLGISDSSVRKHLSLGKKRLVRWIQSDFDEVEL